MKRKKKCDETNKFKYLEQARGITLIALVITIIVLLILAGVSIATLTGENGILTRASDAKIETAVAAVKENLQLEQIEKTIDEEEVTPETLLAEGKVKRTVQQAEDENYYMYYALKEDAVEGMQGLGKGNISSLKDVFLIDDNLNVKYIASNGKEYGDNIEDKILEDETKIRFASKAFSEYISKISGITEEEMKFKWMKNQTKLTINDPTIDSLEDLVFFPNVMTLYLQNCSNLQSIQGIENCQKLNTLSILTCGIINDWKPLEGIKTLKTFTLSNSRIDTLKQLVNSLKNTNIESLSLINMGLKDASSIQELANLKKLTLSYNNINDINFITNLKYLTYLDLISNNINDFLCLSELDNLTELYLKGNINIDGNRENYKGEDLEKLNKIGEILEKGGKIYLDIDKLGLFKNYKSLDLSNENLTNIDVLENMNELEELKLQNNRLTFSEDKDKNIIKNMTKLKILDISNNYIEDISFLNDLNSLTTLNIFGDNNSKIDLKQIEDIISNVILTLSNEQLQTINNCNKQKITRIYLLNSTDLKELPNLSDFELLDTIIISNSTSIKNWENILQAKNLRTINLTNCNLTGKMVDFSSLEFIQNLVLNNNYLTTTDLSVLKKLNNRIINIDLSQNSIINANILINLNQSSIIKLTGNVNLLAESKQLLTNHFGSNVTYDK